MHTLRNAYVDYLWSKAQLNIFYIKSISVK